MADIRRLSELDALREAAAGARTALSAAVDEVSEGRPQSAIDTIGRAIALLESTDDAVLTALARQLTDVLTVVGDAARELGNFLGELPTDASSLETKLSRQAELRSLTRKYAADVDGVLRWAAESRQRLAQLDVSEEALSGLARRVDELGQQVAAVGLELSKVRTKAAKGLAKAVTSELAGLAMADADFTVAVSLMPAREDDSAPLRLPSGESVHAGGEGIDLVEFGFTAHRGTDVLPLNKSASGGELSRVMLALEVVLAASAEGTTMVFDEVDAGVGGRAAVQIGRRLARLARTHQVIVVTHLPQVAAYADIHLVVRVGPRRRQRRATAGHRRSGWPSWPGCWPGWGSPTPVGPTPGNCWRPHRTTWTRPNRVAPVTGCDLWGWCYGAPPRISAVSPTESPHEDVSTSLS